jgi:hypothetical protein
MTARYAPSFSSDIFELTYHSTSQGILILKEPIDTEDDLFRYIPLMTTHNIQPIPAYDIRGDLIHPSEYEEKLAGTIARVCFSIVHYNVKQKNIHHAILRDITVLCPPTTIARSSLTHVLHPPKKKQKIV